MTAIDQDVDWEALYYEINSKLPNDPRFQPEVFYDWTPIDQILKAVSHLRRQENQRLHNESIPLSILTVATLSGNVKDPHKLKEADYQPFRHLVEQDAFSAIPYSVETLDHLQQVCRAGFAPGWLASLVGKTLKNRELVSTYTPIAFSAPHFLGVNPAIKKDRICFGAMFTGPISPNAQIDLYMQRMRKNRTKNTAYFGKVQLPPEYQQPDLIYVDPEVEYIEVPSKAYWLLDEEM